MSGLDAVTFDYWNTLCYEHDEDAYRTLRVEALAGALASEGWELDREAVAEAYDQARAEWVAAWEANGGLFTGRDAALRTCDHLGVDPDSPVRDVLCQAFLATAEHAGIELVDGVAEALGGLKERGVRLGIICDVGFIPSTELRRRLDRFGLLELFDHWSFSDEVGVYKPDPRIFEHALDGLGGVDPSRAAHVGDRRRTDVAGARAAGMRAVRITTVFDDTDPDQGPSGDAVISGYGELFDALGLG